MLTTSRKEKNLLQLPPMETLSLRRPTCSLDATPTAVSMSLKLFISKPVWLKSRYIQCTAGSYILLCSEQLYSQHSLVHRGAFLWERRRSKGEGEYFLWSGRLQSVALCILTAYGLQSAMLSDTTWPVYVFLESLWRGLHNNIKIVFWKILGVVIWITVAQNTDH